MIHIVARPVFQSAIPLLGAVAFTVLPASPARAADGDVGRARIDAVAIVDIPNAVRVNGEPGNEVWQRATAIDEFVQRDPEEGGKPSQRTEVRVAYDPTTLFVRVRAFDTEAARIAGLLTRRD